MTIIQTNKELRKRDVDDHFPTPDAFVCSALNLVPSDFVPERILDPGAGNGVFGTLAKRRWPDAKIAGIETRVVPKPVAYNSWLNLSFVGFEIPIEFDLVIGNPPYKFAEEAVRFGWQHLRSGGYMVYLLRLAFLEGQKRYAGLWREMPPDHVAVCANRPSFTGEWRTNGDGHEQFVANGKTDATAYAFFVWQKHAIPLGEHVGKLETTMSFVMSEDPGHFGSCS